MLLSASSWLRQHKCWMMLTHQRLTDNVTAGGGGNMAVHGRVFLPVGCDSCHGDHRCRVCLGSSCPSSGTFPGLWPLPTTGSQTFHPQEVWRPHTVHRSVVQNENFMLCCHLSSTTHMLLRLSGWVLGRPFRPWPAWPSVPPPSGGGSMRWNINGVRFCVRYMTWPAGWYQAHSGAVTRHKHRMHSQHAPTQGRHQQAHGGRSPR